MKLFYYLFLIVSINWIVQGSEDMRYIENSDVKIGIDLKLGGAISYFADQTKKENMINSCDLGREVQMSFYSGPIPYDNCTFMDVNWPWNPIEAGDRFHNPSTIVQLIQSKSQINITIRPKQWACDNVDCECTFQKIITLDGIGAHVHNIIYNERIDQTDYQNFSQEVPAVYSIGTAYHLLSYVGSKPWTNDQISELDLPIMPNSTFYTASESWAGLSTSENYTLGIYNSDTSSFKSFFSGEKGKGGSKDSNTGYIAPLSSVDLKWNTVYEYDYYLILGDLEKVREYIYEKHEEVEMPKDMKMKKTLESS